MFNDTWRSPWLQCIAPRHTLLSHGVDFPSYSLHHGSFTATQLKGELS